MSEENELHKKVKKILVESLRLKMDPEEITDDLPLFEKLGLDSIDALELVVSLEKEFGVSVTSKDVDRKVFLNVDTIVAFIESNQKGT